MRVWSTARGSESVDALSLPVATCDSAVRPVVRWCPAVVCFLDRVVAVSAPSGAVDRRDRAGPGRVKTATSPQVASAFGSVPSPAYGSRATFRRMRLSAMHLADESGGHRRHPVVEPAGKSPTWRALSASPSRRSQTMKTLLRTLANLLAGRRTPSVEEQYLAQAVDAQDLQVRLLALERARP